MDWADRIGRRIKLRDLHVLQCVAEAGTMSKAARRLAISVPVVSKAIADLEHALGVPLLDRSPQGVEPTPYGRALLRRGLAAFDELRQGVHDIEFLSDPTSGEVRIGSTAPLAASFVSGVIDRLSRRYPRIVFHVTVGDTVLLRRALADRSVDLVIGRGFAPLTDEELAFESLYDNPYVVIAGAKNPLARRRRVELAQLMHEPWVLPTSDPVASLLAEAFRARNLELPRATVAASAYEVRVSLLSTDRYLTILPHSVLRFPAVDPRLRMLPVALPHRRIPIGVITAKNRAVSPAAQLFIAEARALARPLATK
jgi:DNA-binding transcriptional LysR family regulator